MQRWLLIALLAAACGDNQLPGGLDGGVPTDAGGGRDAALPRDGAAPLAWVDFTASGCDFELSQADGGVPRCAGYAPLTLTFEPLAPSEIEQYRWRFGDEDDDKTTDPAAQPVHTYDSPGLYDVSLSASGPGGSGSAVKPSFVEALPSPASRVCTADEQCDSGQCVCKEGACAPAVSPGLCAASCDPQACPDGTVAADLTPVDSADQDWEQCLCLQDCGDAVCPAGTSCQFLRVPAGGWAQGCLPPGLVAPIGASCQSLDDDPDNLCASRECLDEGARGLCAATCESSADCPSGSACATFGSGTKTCLARCDQVSCDGDPWLACEAPGVTAPKGFTVDETPVLEGYCAPKRCAGPEDCGTDGACTDDYCGPS